MAATSQTFDEARHFYTMRVVSFLDSVGAKVARMGVETLVVFAYYHFLDKYPSFCYYLGVLSSNRRSSW